MCSVKKGGYKLKIPTMLLSEKERTRSRFARMRSSSSSSDVAIRDNVAVRKKGCPAAVIEEEEEAESDASKEEEEEQFDEMEDDDDANCEMQESSTSNKARKQTNNSSSSSPMLAQKICNALEGDILSLAEHAKKGLLPSFTGFSMKTEKDRLHCLVQDLRMQCPDMCKRENRESLVFTLLSMLQQEEEDI